MDNQGYIWVIAAIVALFLLIGAANKQKYIYSCTSSHGGSCVCTALDSLDCD